MDEYEAKFLIGVLAGVMTDTNKIGYIADYPIFGMQPISTLLPWVSNGQSKSKNLSGMVHAEGK